MELRVIDDWDGLRNGTNDAKEFSYSHFTVKHATFGRALVKCEDTTLSEVLGYCFAEAIGVPVSRWEGFYLPNATRHGNEPARHGRIGIFIEYDPDFANVDWGDAISSDSKAVVAAIALCCFDRHEWGSFGMAHDRLVFYDLERILPYFTAEIERGRKWQPRIRYLKSDAAIYRRANEGDVKEALKDLAQRYGLVKQVYLQLSKMSEDSEYWREKFLLSPHPLASQLADLATMALIRRLRIARRLFYEAQNR